MATKTITAEALTEASFRGFGQVLDPNASREPDFHGLGSVGWFADFHCGSRPQVVLLRTEYFGLRVSKLERHFQVAQTFIPLEGVPAVLAVAPPTERQEASIPDPDDVRAFLIDGSAGYLLNAGTWHSLDRLPIRPGHSSFVAISDQATTDELASTDEKDLKLTQQVDYEESFDLVFEIDVSRSTG
ncbi:ureidoglycolate lyase [Candidatus Poriferisodalis sp.]|uniref:ureidoglycolate lyase n=1 Tax=Candidatus Poriferisodalis sp. TaxID=3101277 RepID=UPI003AF4997C